MKDLVRYLPEGIVLDLAEPGYGHPRGPALVAELLGNCSRANPVLVCETHGSPVWLQRRPIRRGQREVQVWACHFDGLRCRPAAGGMSDEHKRQTEYVVRAAERAGLRTATEVRLAHGSIRADAVIYGTSSVAVEVQRSGLTATSAVARTRKATEAGMAMSLWLTGRQTPPAWFFRVPSVGMNELPWDVVPAAHSATATTGLRVITAARCRFPDFSRCPATGRAVCGRWHPRHDPWLGRTVDEVASLAPEGGVVPVRFASKFNPILLVSPESRRVYEELTERPTSLALREQAEQPVRPSNQRVECVSPQRVYPSCTRCSHPLWAPQSQALGLCAKCQLQASAGDR